MQLVTDIRGAYDVSGSDVAYMRKAGRKLRNRARLAVEPVHALKVSHSAEGPDDWGVWMPDLSYCFTNVKISPADGLPADIAYNTRFANISSQLGGRIGKSVEVSKRMKLVGGGVRCEKADDLEFIMRHLSSQIHLLWLGRLGNVQLERKVRLEGHNGEIEIEIDLSPTSADVSAGL